MAVNSFIINSLFIIFWYHRFHISPFFVLRHDDLFSQFVLRILHNTFFIFSLDVPLMMTVDTYLLYLFINLSLSLLKPSFFLCLYSSKLVDLYIFLK